MPTTRHPRARAAIVTALMTPFSPGAGPPPFRTPTVRTGGELLCHPEDMRARWRTRIRRCGPLGQVEFLVAARGNTDSAEPPRKLFPDLTLVQPSGSRGAPPFSQIVLLQPDRKSTRLNSS